MAGQVFRVRFVREGQEFEAEGDRKFVLAMLQRFNVPGGSPVAAQSGGPAAKSAATVRSAPGKSVSVGEFVRQLSLKKHTDLVVAFGYYLEHHSGMKDFTPADLNNCYYEAKLEASNTSQAIIQNMKRGFIMESKQPKGVAKKLYTLTNTGEEFIKAKSAKQS